MLQRRRWPAPRVGGAHSFSDEVLGMGISSTVWVAGTTAPFELSRLGAVVTFDVPSEAVPAGQRVIDVSHDVVTETS